MTSTAKAHKLNEEHDLYLAMWQNAITEEGADSSMALLAQSMLEEVLEELAQLECRIPLTRDDLQGYISVKVLPQPCK